MLDRLQQPLLRIDQYWTKIGDALSHSLLRKRSFASQRPILAVPPEPLLEGIQLEQAQDAAEFIYTGRHGCGSNCSHSGTQSAATSSHSYEKRYSWDRVGWSTLTASGTASKSAYGSHHRTTSGLSAPPSMNGGASQPNIFGGRSAPNLSSMADKRQASSGSLWSVFGSTRNGDSVHGDSSSPAPSIYEDAQDSAESSVFPSPSAHFIPLPEIAESGARPTVEGAQQTSAASTAGEESGRAIPVTRVNPLGGVSHASSQPMVSPVSTSTSPASSSISPGAVSSAQSLAPPPQPTRSGSLLKRRNSLSARLRAFKTLGSGMTPVRQQQPSRSYVTR
ncbi:hypothetical protein P389DRAFT_59261 [Cystobasidium minutum MCA 4210]|uniref:uncharacterized protein n=1 Tax=Cystobasidium minutum MCA 4210 TaxID=1397322 RepID=UPI0034CD1E62|eukprot:jgi/Rhomi1/59261/CE59260_2643